jgi:cysteine desulfurase
MLSALDVMGNPSSVHAEGRRVRAIIETAREQVASLVGAKPSEVVFTSGATEANNTVMAAGWKTICVSDIEHDSVLAPARASGANIIALPADKNGVVALSVVAAALASATHEGRTLLSVMLASNETGVIQPLDAATALAREHNVALHVDAVQGPGRLQVNFASLGADTLAVSAHKFGGPRGVGALVIRDGVELSVLIKGGGQERRRRAGTENVTGIAGFGAAAAALMRDAGAAERMGKLRAELEDGILRATPEAIVVGRAAPRIANTTCVALPGKPAETIVIKLDLHGVAVSAGAACSSGKVGPNSVIEAMGLGEDIARSAVRISLGPQTTDQDIAAFLAAWEKVAGRAELAA